MVTDPQRPQYLNAPPGGRPAHPPLVENVLAYARLERGRSDGRISACPSGSSPTDCRPVGRLRRPGRNAARSRNRRADPRRPDPRQSLSLEQILVNLVDNACKYAREAADRRIISRSSGSASDGTPAPRPRAGYLRRRASPPLPTILQIRPPPPHRPRRESASAWRRPPARSENAGRTFLLQPASWGWCLLRPVLPCGSSGRKRPGLFRAVFMGSIQFYRSSTFGVDRMPMIRYDNVSAHNPDYP